LAEKKKQYRTLMGVVQFDPREAQAGGKDVRNITIRAHGVKDQSIRVSATLWPSHEHVAVDKGDFVVLEGAFTVNKGEKDGEPVTYFNLSVSGILNLGPLDFGEQVERVNTRAADTEDEVEEDDIPY
jgi:hypothetical protein